MSVRCSERVLVQRLPAFGSARASPPNRHGGCLGPHASSLAAKEGVCLGAYTGRPQSRAPHALPYRCSLGAPWAPVMVGSVQLGIWRQRAVLHSAPPYRGT